jgi:hypothetical protein
MVEIDQIAADIQNFVFRDQPVRSTIKLGFVA